MKLFEKKYLLRSIHGQLWAVLFFINKQMTGEASWAFGLLAMVWMIAALVAWITRETA